MSLRALIAALPECAPKAALRGMEIAAAQHDNATVPRETVQRMAQIVRSWKEELPLLKLEAHLEQLLTSEEPDR
jgi:hypothetical protein